MYFPLPPQVQSLSQTLTNPLVTPNPAPGALLLPPTPLHSIYPSEGTKLE